MNTVAICQSLKRDSALSVASANCPHVCGRKVGSGPAFLGHIDGVLFLRTEKQVFGSDTSLHIASVEHKKPRRNGTISHLPRQAVCGVIYESLAIGGGYKPVTTSRGCGPEPTGFRLVDVQPKSLFKGFSSILVTGHGVTSKIGCKVSRLARGLTTTCGPFVFYHDSVVTEAQAGVLTERF